MFQNTITSGSQMWEYITPIKVSSLKAIYFAFAPQSYSGLDNPREATAIGSFAYASPNGADANTLYPMRTTWFSNNSAELPVLHRW
jgi:hypothetical protein